jgi:RHS repeat-associated protein
VAPNSTLGNDLESRLHTVTGSGSSFSSDYDADGLRTATATEYGNVYFVYDGDTRMLKLNANGSVDQAYAWGADGMRALYNGGDTYYDYSYDPEGNLGQRQGGDNSSTYAASTSVYDAYGKLLGTALATGAQGYESAAIGFAAQSGGYTDIDPVVASYGTGLVYMTHRYYDPKVGRFVNRDPIGYHGGVNVYAYAGNNPITRGDPSGEADEPGRGGNPWISEDLQDLLDAAQAYKDINNEIERELSDNLKQDAEKDELAEFWRLRQPNPVIRSFPDWQPFDPIDKLTPEGTYPKWTAPGGSVWDRSQTVQGRYWITRSYLAAEGEFSDANIARMRQGLAPKMRVVVRINKTGEVVVKFESKELHHANQGRGVPGFDTRRTYTRSGRGNMT